MTCFAELVAASHFSFLRGASHPADLIARAIELGLTGIGIADRNTVAGVVRAQLALRHARTAGFDGPVTPWADRTTLAGRSRERIVRLTGERMESLWKEADLPIVPRWFTPVARDQFGRPIEDEALPTPGGMPTPASPSVP